ncbi:alpha/beta hydrolase [Candidatus Deianiraea vastatrix]|uniref:Esterase n=1 Tax=Candidatus Deianiraea vastatrix TaxID=2163644 RepID=A0A5B8XFJ1_9RICK|nr:alpha/beta hydrolase-fold protein [Candidatus Deianiraea vastatrix]QED23759.1 Putative esterase [Candidatus Deianiraea vastatrix]
MKKSALFIVLISFLFTINNALAKQVSLKNTKVHYLKSSKNGINYRLYISLPKHYKTSKDSYPVVYLLDQDYSFAIAHNIFEHLSDRGFLQEAILVAIGYTDQDKIPDYNDKKSLSMYTLNRTRDYTPISTYKDNDYDDLHYKKSGNAAKFKAFIKDELFPFINQKYRTNEQKTIVGHSYGGLFVTWVYLTDGDMFNNYIAVSPSFWYKDRYIFSQIDKAKINQEAKLYMTVGLNETKRMIQGVREMAEILKSDNVKTEFLADENHSSIFATGLTHGTQFCLKPKNRD